MSEGDVVQATGAGSVELFGTKILETIGLGDVTKDMHVSNTELTHITGGDCIVLVLYIA